ncbi:hypothetical protein OHS33_14645 [Streptomyces sp. NBC_00536]|uniref:hypothetical protein n=1 Tax=Streptomyces sp. NBC_00536 TaxID=2975769 RepID=UPI002E80E5C7|nr:hypothetical protein [Streptomyces sp. NBC_00536]WUC79459.1 hypothetical protein OHS33_14645 [Streptomyces sp. NBC_00536]
MAWLPALLTLLAALCLGYWALRAHPGLVTGRDGRLSTSKTLAAAWTGLLVWMLVVLLGYGLTQGIGWFHGPDNPLGPLTGVYLPLLGGPYLALIGAKGVVGVRVQNGRLFKPEKKPAPAAAGPAAGPEQLPMGELVSNDSGQTDLMDLQYVTFSIVTMLYVAAFFVADVGAGLPKLPTEIWALTGAPAAAYLLNKVATRPNPVITRVTRAGDQLRIEGGGFADDATHGRAKVTINAEPQQDADLGADGVLTLTRPAPADGPEAPFTVYVTARGLRSDPYVYRAPAAAPVVTQRPAPTDQPTPESKQP